MNWEMIGAIGEVTGAIAVVITLVYLARQIQVSNQASRRSAMQELLDQTHLFTREIIGDEELASIWGRGFADFEALEPTEQVRFRIVLHQLTLIWERFFYLDRSIGLEPWIADLNERTCRDMAATPGYRRWFNERKEWFGDDFQGWVEERMKESSGYEQTVAVESGLPVSGASSATDG